MDPTTILAYLKLPTKVLAGIALASIAVLASPASWVAATGLAKARTDYRWALGLAIWIPLALLLVELVAALWMWQRARVERDRKKREIDASRAYTESEVKRVQAEADARRAAEEQATRDANLKFLGSMTDAERAECAKFIDRAARTVWLYAENGSVRELSRRGVLYLNSPLHFDMKFQGMGGSFTMTDWAWEHLGANRDLLTIRNPGPPARLRR